mmetsp:Transcript_45558/g.109356  ORF Transcript_45558/g.109356 Transcript_45558/m.109356 type:complete len:218 (-) Transcript_45558:1837-2490(-)
MDHPGDADSAVLRMLEGAELLEVRDVTRLRLDNHADEILDGLLEPPQEVVLELVQHLLTEEYLQPLAELLGRSKRALHHAAELVPLFDVRFVLLCQRRQIIFIERVVQELGVDVGQLVDLRAKLLVEVLLDVPHVLHEAVIQRRHGRAQPDRLLGWLLHVCLHRTVDDLAYHLLQIVGRLVNQLLHHTAQFVLQRQHDLGCNRPHQEFGQQRGLGVV